MPENAPSTEAPKRPYPLDAVGRQWLERIFTYHPPKPGQPERYEELRSKGKELAELIVQTTPQTREQLLAFTALEEAIFWANAAIARNE